MKTSLICTLLCCAEFLFSQTIVINEFVASNSTGFRDEDNTCEDWIELYNTGSTPVDLSGYTLTDNLKQPAKWTFPAVAIYPSGYLLVWASGKDRLAPTSPHTNFKLDKSREQIGLFSPSGAVVDSLTFGSQFNDLSYGRVPDGGASWHFLTPTPAAANMSTVDPPRFSAEQGMYLEPVTVDIHSETAGAVIRYSLNGSNITTTSPVWRGPLYVNKDTLIRAAAFRGMEKSPVVTKTYLIDVEATIPTISLAIDPVDLYDETTGFYTNWEQSGSAWERPGHMAYFLSDQAFGFSIECGFRIHGSSSREFPKKSLRVYFRSEYDSGTLKYDLFPKSDIDQFDKVVLHTGSADQLFYPGRWTLMKNALVAETARLSYALAARGRFVAVYLNGENWGIYYLRERVDEQFLLSHFGTDRFDLLKGTTMVELEVVAGSENHWNETYHFFETADLRAGANYARAHELIDIDNFIDYQIIGSFIGDHDWPHNNFYMMRQLDGDTRWRWLFWDSDHAFANAIAEDHTLNSIEWMTRPWLRKDLKLFGDEDQAKYLWGTLMLRKLLENEEFKHKFVMRYADLLNTLLNPKNFSRRVDSLKTVLEPNIYKEYGKWSPFTHKNASPYWGKNMTFLRDYVQNRQEVLRRYLEQKFQLRSTLNLTVNVQGGGRVKVNSVYPDSLPWTGKYFSTYPVVLKAEPKEGSEFLRWSNPAFPQQDSISVPMTGNISITAIFSEEVVKQKLAFDKGWNTFSLALSPKGSHDLLDILAPIKNNLEKVVDENGRTIEKLFGVWQNYIGDWQPTEGYSLKADSAVSLEVFGHDIELPFAIELTGGWNMISYVCRDHKQDALLVFDELIKSGRLVKVVDRKGQTIEQLFGVWQNYIGNVKPDEGLKVKVNETCILTQSCSDSALAKEMAMHVPRRFVVSRTSTYEPMHLYFADVRINGEMLEQGDEIAVFDGDVLVGAAVVQPEQQRPVLVAAGKGDGSLPGFVENHPISVQVWQKKTNRIVPVANGSLQSFDTNGKTDENRCTFKGLSSLILNIDVTELAPASLPTEVFLYQNYPNPFNPSTTIPYALPEKSHVTVQVYDIRGALVRVLESGEKEAGTHRIQWDGRDSRGQSVSAGVYMCRLVCGNVVQTKKLLYIK